MFADYDPAREVDEGQLLEIVLQRLDSAQEEEDEA